MKIDIKPLESIESHALENFLVLIYGENLRNLAKQYLTCMFSSDLHRPNFIIACENDRIIGAAAYSEEIFTTDTWGISWVSVHPDHRNKGIGQKLIESCCTDIIKKADKTVTAILATYPGKTGLYEKTGFIKAGQSHEGGYYMIKVLKA